MRRTRGFRIGHKLVKVFKSVTHNRSRRRYRRLSCAVGAVSKVCNWVNSLKQGALRLCFSKPNSGYSRVGSGPKPVGVPKGHLAVYVGEDEDYVHRVLVPVMYFNHPLFEELLREAEKVYGFNHPGGIQIPCRVSEFENIQTMIAAGGGRGGGCWRRDGC